MKHRWIQQLLTSSSILLLLFLCSCVAPGYNVSVVPIGEVNKGSGSEIELNFVWLEVGKDAPPSPVEWFTKKEVRNSYRPYDTAYYDPSTKQVTFKLASGEKQSSKAALVAKLRPEDFRGMVIYANYEDASGARLKVAPGKYLLGFAILPSLTVYLTQDKITDVQPE